MKLSQRLFELIATYMSRPGHIAQEQPEADFIMSGLRAANSASSVTRGKILSDVSNVLDCKSEDLEFLFSEFSSSKQAVQNYEVMVPDFQTQLLEAAE